MFAPVQQPVVDDQDNVFNLETNLTEFVQFLQYLQFLQYQFVLLLIYAIITLLYLFQLCWTLSLSFYVIQHVVTCIDPLVQSLIQATHPG